MADLVKGKLATDGYTAEFTPETILLSATGRSYDQRDDRAYQSQLLVPAEDARRVVGLLTDAIDAVEEMGGR